MAGGGGGGELKYFSSAEYFFQLILKPAAPKQLREFKIYNCRALHVIEIDRLASFVYLFETEVILFIFASFF